MNKATYQTIKREYTPRIKAYFQIFRDYENDFCMSDEGLQAYSRYWDALQEFAEKLHCTPFQATGLLNMGGVRIDVSLLAPAADCHSCGITENIKLIEPRPHRRGFSFALQTR